MRKKSFLFVSLLTYLFLLVGCNFGKSSSNNGDVQEKDNSIVFYSDSKPIENDNIKLEFDEPYCRGTTNYILSIYLNITNKEYETKTYNIKNVVLVKESTSAKYSVSYSKSRTVEAEMTSKFLFSVEIPSDIKIDNYKLSFSINSFNITYYPYEKPDELREDRTIRYHILNKVVKTDTVKDGRTISNIYTYESSDNLRFCNVWYLDSNYSTRLTSSTIINEDIDLYGIESSNIKFMTTTSDVWSFVSGVNHVPSNGILILPEKYLNKELAMSNYAIKDITVSKIYIPKTMHTIYMGNFKNIGNATIYYEGTEAEWRALFYSSSDIVTTNVVCNTKAPK